MLSIAHLAVVALGLLLVNTLHLSIQAPTTLAGEGCHRKHPEASRILSLALED